MSIQFSSRFSQIKLFTLVTVMIFTFLTVRQVAGKQPISPQAAFAASPDIVHPDSIQASSPEVAEDPLYTYEWETVSLARSEIFDWQKLAFQLDSNDHPHVLYGASDLYYAWYDGVVWRKQVVVGNLERIKSDTYPTPVLSLDSHNKPHVLFLYDDDSNTDLQYAYQAEDGWKIETIDSFPPAFTSYSLALDNNNVPHISYISDSGIVRYAYRGINSWVIEDINALPIAEFQNVSLALDSQNRPHIALSTYLGGYTSHSIMYAYKSGENWIVETISVFESGWLTLSLLLDSHDSPHIAILEYPLVYLDSYATHYAYKTGEAWHVEVLAEGAEIKGMELDSQDIPHLLLRFQSSIQDVYRIGDNQWIYNSLTYFDNYHINHIIDLSFGLDSHNQIHIFQQRRSASYDDYHYLEYIYKINGIWQAEAVDASGIGSHQSGMATDSQGDLHLAFGIAGKVQYNHWQGGRRITEIVDDETGAIGPLELVLDAEDVPHLLYYDFGNSTLKYAHKSASGWIIESIETEIPQNIEMPYFLAVSDEGRPSIIHLAPIWNYYEIYYTYRAGAVLISELITDKSSRGSVSTVVIDSQGIPYISYVEKEVTSSESFQLAHRLGPNDWNIETITGELFPDYRTPWILRLDQMDQPHILFIEHSSPESDGNYIYAYKQADSWVFETIATNVWNGFSVMALDEQNQPHTTFIQEGSTNYAYRDENGWFVETIDDELASPKALDIALDGEGEPHLSYYSSESDSLHYYHKEDSVWVEETVNGYFYNSPMPLDEHGLPAFISNNLPYDYSLDLVRKQLHSVSDVIPVEGGVLATPDGQTTLIFPADAFSDTVRITMTFSQTLIRQGDLWGIGYEVNVTAVYSATNEPAQLLPDHMYTITVNYQNYPPAIEDSLSFYHRDGAEWIKETSSTLDIANKRIQVTSDVLGHKAILGSTYQLFFPVILHYPVRW